MLGRLLTKRPLMCVVASAGGHLAEALLCLEGVSYARYLVTYRLPHTDRSLAGQEYYYVLNPHTHWWRYPLNFVQSLLIYVKKRPRFILTTGSGMALATCLIGKALGSRIIFVETGARSRTASLTARLLYPLSDLFVVQWPPLLKLFAKATYGGLLF